MIAREFLGRRLVWIGLGWAIGIFGIIAPAEAGALFVATSLATDASDSQLINPWGISSAPTGPFWISDNGAGASTLYAINPTTNVATKLSFPSATGVAIPGDGSVTGQTF